MLCLEARNVVIKDTVIIWWEYNAWYQIRSNTNIVAMTTNITNVRLGDTQMETKERDVRRLSVVWWDIVIKY